MPTSLSANEESLIPQLYDELRRLAQAKLANEPKSPTLQATVLVHEVYIKLANQSEHRWKNRSQFFAIAAETMRRILVDRARRRMSAKHGGEFRQTDVDFLELPNEPSDEWILGVHGALDELSEKDPVRAEVVKLKFFTGLTSAEIGAALDLSEKTVRRHWNFAKAQLFESLSADG